MNIKTEYLVGKISGNDWSGVYGYRPDYGTENSTELFCVVRLKSDAQNVELERIAKMLLDEFQDAYYNYSEDEDEIVKLEESLQKMKTKLEVIVSREDEILEKGMDIEMSIALVNQEMMVVGVIGDSKVFIFRNGKLVDISKGLVDANMMGFVKTGSLKLLNEDRVLLTTSVPSNNSLEKLENVASNLQVDLLGDVSNDSGSVALIFADESQEWDKKKLEEEKLAQEQAAFEQSQSLNDSDNFQEVESMDLEQSATQNSFNQDFDTQDSDDFVSEVSSTAYAMPSKLAQAQNANAIPFSEEWEDDGRENDIDLVPPQTTNITTVGKLTSAVNVVRSRLTGLGSKLPSRSNLPFSDKNQSFNNDDDLAGGQGYDEDENVTSQNSTYQNVRSKTTQLKNMFASKSNSISSNFSGDKTYQQVFKNIIKFIKQAALSFVQFIKKDVIGLDRLDRTRNAQKLKRNRAIMVVVLIVLVGLIYVVWKNADTRALEAKRVQEATAKVAQLETDVNQAVSRVETEKNEDQSKKDILNNRLTTLSTSIENQKKEGLFVEDLDRLKLKINSAKDSLSFIKEVNDSNVQVVTDVGKLFSDTNLSDLEISNGFLYSSDAKRNVIYKIPTSLNSTAQEVVKNLNIPEHLVRNAAGNIVLFDSDTTSAMGVLNVQSSQFTRLTGLSTALIGDVTEAAIYSNNDALYEIHQNHQQIFKREKVGNSYGGGGSIYVTINPPNWKTDSEFAKAIDIAVPYEVYVLIEGSGLKRYLSGGDNTLTYDVFQNFAQTDFNAIAQATSFGIDQNYLAIADSKNKRVMVFEIIDNEQKNVKFLQQFVYRGSNNLFNNIKEVVVDQSTNTVYVLDGSKVLKVSL